MRLPIICSVLSVCLLAITACSKAPQPSGTIISPGNEFTLSVSKSDLGACCANRILISAVIFGETVPDLVEIRGSLDVRYEWTDEDSILIIACDASHTSYRSGFRNNDYTRRFILTVINERPSEDGARVICGSPRFNSLAKI